MIFEGLTFLVIFLITYSFGDFSNEAIDTKFTLSANIERKKKFRDFLNVVQKIKLSPLKYWDRIFSLFAVFSILNYILNLLSFFRLVLIVFFLLVIFYIIINSIENYLKKKIIEIKFHNDKNMLNLVSLFDDKFLKTMTEYIKNNLHQELENNLLIFNNFKNSTENFEYQIKLFDSFNKKFEAGLESYSRFKPCDNCIWNKKFLQQNQKFFNSNKKKKIKKHRKSMSVDTLTDIDLKNKHKRNGENSFKFAKKCHVNCAGGLKSKLAVFQALGKKLN